jgi:pimeloyl-ACP methyl ester carboxylesterase
VRWLETLKSSNVPTTIIWGELDDIAPVAVPDYVWDNYLQNRETPAGYWRIPCADHYLQVDVPDLMANIIRATLAEDKIPAKIDGNLCQPLKIY